MTLDPANPANKAVSVFSWPAWAPPGILLSVYVPPVQEGTPWNWAIWAFMAAIMAISG
jgi:hypothetical protein